MINNKPKIGQLYKTDSNQLIFFFKPLDQRQNRVQIELDRNKIVLVIRNREFPGWCETQVLYKDTVGYVFSDSLLSNTKCF